MNEQRQEAYLNLIQSLLNCPGGEEAEILAANSELVDAGLVEMMLAVAEMASREGNENVANSLMDVAQELAEVLNLTSEEPHPSPLLGGEGTDSPPLPGEGRAMTQNNLGIVYRNRIKGDKAQNIELAIAAYTDALKVRTQTAFPQNHAETAFNLGLAYQDKKDFDSAYQTFAAAIHTVETMRGYIVSGEEIKRKQSLVQNSIFSPFQWTCAIGSWGLQPQASIGAVEIIGNR